MTTGAKGEPSRSGQRRRRRDQPVAKRPAEPLDWRSRHDPLGEGRPAVARHALSIADADGSVAYPHRVFDTLAALLRNGSIGEREYAAARQFQDDWERARLDPLSVPSLERTPGQGGGPALSEIVLGARERVWRALQGLGGHASPIGQAAWHVLGWGLTVKEFATRTQLGGGRALDEKTARGLVVGACCVLAGWYLGHRPPLLHTMR
jgi:hypothetical protein